jgi:hypothetical protein
MVGPTTRFATVGRGGVLAAVCAAAALSATAAATTAKSEPTITVNATVTIGSHTYRGRAKEPTQFAPKTSRKGTFTKSGDMLLQVHGIPFPSSDAGSDATVSFSFRSHGRKIIVTLSGANIFQMSSSGSHTSGLETLNIEYTGDTVS